ncbi:MAG: glutamate racemase [bacterium]
MIGIFDSGIGGLTIVKAMQKALPGHPFIYLGDTNRMPYGSKSPEAIIEYSLQDAQYLVDQGAKLIVVACNSASSAAIPELTKRFPEIPVFDVITPTVAEAKKVSKGRIGVIGTRATINSEIYNKLLKAGSKLEVFGKACPLLVPLVEENWLDQSVTKMVVRKYLSPLKAKNIDTLILGCTHYPLLKNEIQHKSGKTVKIIDSAQVTAESVKKYLSKHPELDKQLKKPGQSIFALTDVTPHANNLAVRWLGQPVKFEKVILE